MNPFRLLFSFRGRTGRAAFLFGIVLAKVIAVALLWATSSDVLIPRLLPLQPYLARIGVANAASVQTGLWMLIGALFLWMILALTFKRLHDRGHFGFWALVAFVPMAAMLLLESSTFTVRPLVALPEPAHFAIWGVSLVVAAWVVIECLLLPGARLDAGDDDDDGAFFGRRRRLAQQRE